MKYLFAALNLLLISSVTFSQIPKSYFRVVQGKIIKPDSFLLTIGQNPATTFLFNKRYLPWRKDVSMCLTDIDKDNLEVIKNWELNLRKKI